MPSPAEFDKFAADYQSLHASNIAASGESPDYFADLKMRDLAAHLRAATRPLTGNFLDYGCGVGNSVAPFRRHLPEAKLTGVDVSAESLRMAREAHPEGVRFVQIDAGSLPFETAYFDGAFACCVFHHIPHVQHVEVLSQIRRTMRPGAVLMLYEHNPWNPLTVRAVNTCPLDADAHLITAPELVARCRAAGFSALRTEYRVFFPHALARLRVLEPKLKRVPLGAQYAVYGLA